MSWLNNTISNCNNNNNNINSNTDNNSNNTDRPSLYKVNGTSGQKKRKQLQQPRSTNEPENMSKHENSKKWMSVNEKMKEALQQQLWKGGEMVESDNVTQKVNCG